MSKESSAKWQKENPDKVRIKAKRYYDRHPDACKKRSRDWYYANREHSIKNCRERRKINPERTWAGYSIAGHKKDGYEVLITVDELTAIAKNTHQCSMCGNELKWGERQSMDSPTMDRKDNKNSLDVDSVWIVCKRCNTSKLNRSMSEFIDFCKMVVQKFAPGGN